jgi:hypothetical protein
MPPLTQPYLTLDDVVTGFGELENGFRRAHDRRSVFLTLYAIVSSAIREAIARRAFEDAAWVERYAVAFANLYRDALLHYGSGQLERVPKAWIIGFDAARAAQGLVLQDMLLGVNAHVNNDLPLALLAVGIGPDRASRYRDHTAVNQVLASVTELATERLMALYAPGLGKLDEVAGQIDELISAFSLEVARESAWDAALALSDARSAPERAVTTRLLSARAAVVAKLLRAPSRSAAFVRACRLLEQTDWIALTRACLVSQLDARS